MEVKQRVRIGIINGYPRADRADLDLVGMISADELFAAILRREFPDLELESLFLADADEPIPSGAALNDFDGFIWTGSKLTIYHDTPEVKRQIEFSKALFEAGKPQCGSCWGVQMAAVAAGGEVEKMEQGRETFINRKITLTPEGRNCLLYDGNPEVFDGFVNHLDEVTKIPTGGVLLSVGEHCHVQALEVVHKKGTFWGWQYHPEYNLNEMALLMEARAEALVAEGFYPDESKLVAHTTKVKQLYKTPDDATLRTELQVGDDILGKGIREAEIRNFINHLVLPSLAP